MVHQTTAIFEKGTFKPIKPVKGIPEHATVRISVETIVPPSRHEQLASLAAVPVAKRLAAQIEKGGKQPWSVDAF
ncbi:MAG: antitoxin family protein [bacterium]|nr:antitoxin family protein [bacterium]